MIGNCDVLTILLPDVVHLKLLVRTFSRIPTLHIQHMIEELFVKLTRYTLASAAVIAMTSSFAAQAAFAEEDLPVDAAPHHSDELVLDLDNETTSWVNPDLGIGTTTAPESTVETSTPADNAAVGSTAENNAGATTTNEVADEAANGHHVGIDAEDADEANVLHEVYLDSADNAGKPLESYEPSNHPCTTADCDKSHFEPSPEHSVEIETEIAAATDAADRVAAQDAKAPATNPASTSTPKADAKADAKTALPSAAKPAPKAAASGVALAQTGAEASTLMGLAGVLGAFGIALGSRRR